MARAWEPAPPPTFWQVSEINVHKVKLKTQVEKDRNTGGTVDNLSVYAVWPGTGSPGNEEDTVHIASTQVTGVHCPHSSSPLFNKGNDRGWASGTLPNPQLPSPAPRQTSAVVSPPSLPHPQIFTQIFSHSLSHHLTLVPTSNSKRHSLGTCQPCQPGKPVGELQMSTTPPLLQIQPPTLIPSSVASHLLWPLLPLCPHSQGTKQTLPAHLNRLKSSLK